MSLPFVLVEICDHDRFYQCGNEPVRNKRGYNLCQQCYDKQTEAERRSDEFYDRFYSATPEEQERMLWESSGSHP